MSEKPIRELRCCGWVKVKIAQLPMLHPHEAALQGITLQQRIVQTFTRMRGAGRYLQQFRAALSAG